MAKIRCHYVDCEFLDENYCSAAQIEIDPNGGCQTYVPNTESTPDDDWDEEEEVEEWEEAEDDDDDEDDMWLEEEEGEEY
jgi:hypothetical protein